MTPGARIAAAIEILDAVIDGEAAEKALTTWGRRSRFAGSGDRAAIRDHVFDGLRCRRSFGFLGGSDTGRGLMIGLLRAQGTDLDDFFSGHGHAPAPLDAGERATRTLEDAPDAVKSDMPDWLIPELSRSLGPDMPDVCQALRARAGLHLRVNALKTDRPAAIAKLAGDDVTAEAHPLCETALRVTGNPRRLRNAAAYLDGDVEIQDAASQAVVQLLPRASRVLDYCAGGGGKALALAAGEALVWAYDADPARMRDLPARAGRAGVDIKCITTADIDQFAPFEMVLCDVPCSGSGAWARSPEAKWRLTEARLNELEKIQLEILENASRFVTEDGVLAYATCSVLQVENDDLMERFCRRHPYWQLSVSRRFSPLDGGDGFFCAVLTRTR